MYKSANPAVIRATFREMTTEQLKDELNVIFELAKIETKTNKKQMLISLYQYAQSLIKSR
jgi:hypothetical protein